MNILVVGNGAREHALAWKLSQSASVSNLFVLPGNGGTALWHRTQNVAISVNDLDGIVSFSLENSIDLVVVGPEAPLADGLTDKLTESGIKSFGPTKNAAQLESSKVFDGIFSKKKYSVHFGGVV